MSFFQAAALMHLRDDRLGRLCSGRERVTFVDENHQVDDSCERLRARRENLRAHVQAQRITGNAIRVDVVDTLTDSARRGRVFRASASSTSRAMPQSSDRAMVCYEPIRVAGELEPFRVWSGFLISSVDEPDRLGPGLDLGLS